MGAKWTFKTINWQAHVMPNLKPSLRSSSYRRVKKIQCEDVKKLPVKQSSARKPSVPFIDGSVFSTEALNHNWGAWATVIISGLGLLGQFLSISRNAVTRDDVWLTKNSVAPCDIIETRKGYPAPHRKYMLINPNKKVPEGLLKTMQSDIEECCGNECDIVETSSDGFWRWPGHIIASLSLLYLVLSTEE